MRADVKAAMVDLHLMSRQSGPTDSTKAAANIAIIGILYLNGFAGRSGEWQIMKKAYVLEQLDAGADHLIWSNHKTAKVYGDLAKWIAPGTATAIRVYLGLDGKVSNLLFEPVRATTQHACVNYCLRRFGEVYFPGREAPACNLIRKMFHTSLMQMSQQGKVLDLLSKVDAHSKRVAKDVYTCATPGDDAQLGKILFEQVMKDPVPWPTTEELDNALPDAKARVSALTELAFAVPLADESEDDDQREYCCEKEMLVLLDEYQHEAPAPKQPPVRQEPKPMRKRTQRLH